MELDKTMPMETALRELVEAIGKMDTDRIDQLIKPEYISCDGSVPQLTFRYKVEDWELNHFESMHGGMISTIFDNSLGCLSHYIAGNGLVTTSTLTTNYIKPIPHNSSVLVTAKATNIGKTLIHLSGEAHLEGTNRLVATATAIYMFIKKPLTEMSTFKEQKGENTTWTKNWDL